LTPQSTRRQKLPSTCHRNHHAIGTCTDTLQPLIDADPFGAAHTAHLRSCQPCRTTTNQFAAITDFAHTNALAPSPHVARSLALIVAGFSAPPSTAPPHD